MKTIALLALVAAVGATGASSVVTVAPSSIGFKQLRAACPGALAGVAFVLGHARVAEAPGVTTDIDEGEGPMQSVVLTASNGASATVTLNGQSHTVSAKNVKLSGKTAACVSPD